MADNQSASNTEKFLTQPVQEQLRQVFDLIPHDIPIYLFRRKDNRSEDLQLIRDLFSAFQDVTRKIDFREVDISHKLAKKRGIVHSPAIGFAPERFGLFYLGIPLGEEGRTLVETLILVGVNQSQLSAQSVKIMGRLNEPRRVKVFVSPTCPYCPQQAVNAIKAGIERPDLVTVEIVDTSFNEELAERYSAYSVPQTYANDVLIAQGAQAEELFAGSLMQLEQLTYFIPESDAQVVDVDLVIVGSGPAGLTAGIYAARSGLKSVIIEKDALGGQVALTPVVENYPGLAHTGGKNLVDIMVTHALEYVNVFPREEVLEIEIGDPFTITTSIRRFHARAVLLATGASVRRLNVPGETRFAGRGVSYCSTCDGPLFKGKRVVMVGGGNTAVTEALHLHHIGARVTLIHRRDSLRAQDHLLRDLDTNEIPILWNTEVVEIRGKEKVTELLLKNNQSGVTEVFPTDGLFIAIGYLPEVKLARQLGVELTPEGYTEHDGRHRTNIPGIYTAGDVEGGYKQIVTAAGAGAAAAMNIFEDLTHPYWKKEG